MKQVKVNDRVKVNSPDMSGIWEVISIYNDKDYGMKTSVFVSVFILVLPCER